MSDTTMCKHGEPLSGGCDDCYDGWINDLREALEESKKTLEYHIENIHDNLEEEDHRISIRRFIEASFLDCGCDYYAGYDCGCSKDAFVRREGLRALDKLSDY